MFKVIKAAFLLSLLFCGVAHAGQFDQDYNNKFYAGANVGNNVLSTKDNSGNIYSHDEADMTFVSPFIGYRFNKYFALEAGHSFSASDGRIKNDVYVSNQSTFIDTVFMYPNNNIDYMLFLGLNLNKSTYNYHSMDGAESSENESSNSSEIGLGVQYHINNHVGLRVSAKFSNEQQFYGVGAFYTW